MGVKILLGGSPCTYWTIAQTQKREVEAEGVGWELFKNYLIAKDKFQPHYFLYENNQTAAPEIKQQIAKSLEVDLMHINSSLVSAQSRKRFYAFNWEVEQPEERGFVVADVLEQSPPEEKSYPLTSVSQVALTRKFSPEEAHFLGSVGGRSQGDRVYTTEGKSCTLMANGGGRGAKTGLYAVPVRVGIIGKGGQGERIYHTNGKSTAHIATGGVGLYAIPSEIECTKLQPLTTVLDGKTSIKGKQCNIKLPDGDYVIRKLTPLECERLQTMPDNYTEGVSNTQRYKGLGNGWTAEVIIHILQEILKNIPKDEEITVLSMYDGIGTGRYCLEKMGFTNITYHAYEIDKYAMQIANKNYPDIIQHGDAFSVRENDWVL